MSSAGNSEKFDADMLRCKVDVLRARNVISLQDNNARKNPETQDSIIETNAAEMLTHKDTSPMPQPQVETQSLKEPAPPPKPAESVNQNEETETSGQTPEVPSFDLAEEIMAEHRRITAIKRKAPSQKAEAQRLKPEVQPVDHIIEEPKQALSEQEKIIAEIVAKDIERLCKGGLFNKQ